MAGNTATSIHGKITLDCTGYQIDLFNRSQENAEMIQEKGSLPLDGPDLAPLGFDPIVIIVDLKVDDEELCNGFVTWSPNRGPTDEWLDDEVQGKNGSVLVTYTVMFDACLSELHVSLNESVKQSELLKIHGDIVVYVNDMQYLRYSVFSKRSNDGFIIKPLDSIPLSRSLFVCRWGSSLVVKLDLWNSVTREPLARGALLFPLEYYGELLGEIGTVQVKVNYLFHMHHPKTYATMFRDLLI